MTWLIFKVTLGHRTPLTPIFYEDGNSIAPASRGLYSMIKAKVNGTVGIGFGTQGGSESEKQTTFSFDAASLGAVAFGVPS